MGDEAPREASCHERNKLSLITTCQGVSMIALSRKPLTVVRRNTISDNFLFCFKRYTLKIHLRYGTQRI